MESSAQSNTPDAAGMGKLETTWPSSMGADKRNAARSAARNAARQAERRLVVYLEEPQRRWLRGIEADALRDDVRLSASAIVRLAIDELRARGVDWQGLADRPPEGCGSGSTAVPGA